MIIYPASPRCTKHNLNKFFCLIQTACRAVNTSKHGWMIYITALPIHFLEYRVFKSAIITEGGKYFNGDQDIDAAVKAVMDKVAIYMAE